MNITAHQLTCRFCRSLTVTEADAESWRQCSQCGAVNEPSSGYRRTGKPGKCGQLAEQKYAKNRRRALKQFS